MKKGRIISNNIYRRVGDNLVFDSNQQVVKYILKVKDGEYYADSLIELLYEVMKHRFQHWRNGDGWRD